MSVPDRQGLLMEIGKRVCLLTPTEGRDVLWLGSGRMDSRADEDRCEALDSSRLVDY
jgi:hypothetical protein